jgi:hypothetical protein
MSTHGEIMEAMYSKRLFDAQKSKSSGISKRQAKPVVPMEITFMDMDDNG